MKKTNSIPAVLGMLVLGGLVFAWTAVALSAAGQEKEDPQIEALLKKPAPLAQADQEDLARAIFKKMAAAADNVQPEFFERYYKLVMDKCPDTDRAHESYWRLTNLYSQAYDEPKNEEIVRILEQFLARYQTSTVVSMKKYPDEMLVFSPIRSLHQAYEALGRYEKITAYYDKVSTREAEFSVYDYFDYASALDKTNRLQDAVAYYEKFLKKSAGSDDMDFMREIAQDRIDELKKKNES
jgi:tetratricopeptide (TPR) repeat protein